MAKVSFEAEPVEELSPVAVLPAVAVPVARQRAAVKPAGQAAELPVERQQAAVKPAVAEEKLRLAARELRLALFVRFAALASIVESVQQRHPGRLRFGKRKAK